MKTLHFLLLLIACTITIGACKKDETRSSSCDAEIPIVGDATPFTVLSDTLESATCHVQQVEFGPKWSEFISLDPQGSVIWPGAALSYPSIKSGAYTPLSGDRKPITISASLPGIIGNTGRVLQNPSLSSARTAMNEILQQQQQGAATPAQMSWKQTEIYNERHFKLAIGGNYGSFFTDINASFQYDNASIKGRFLFQYTQVYYSVDCDAPNAGIGNFFNNPPSCNDALIGGYSPCYVSSVKYGRKAFLLVESSQYDYSYKAQIQASFDGLLASGSGYVDATLTNLINQHSIKGIIMGGSSSSAIEVVNNTNQLYTWLHDGADFNINTSPGVPLSYTLRFMKDNSVASVVNYDNFSVRECTIIPASSLTTTITPSELNEIRLYRTNGDQEFAGNGPKVTVKVSYEKRNSDKELWQVLFVQMKETISDYTTGEATYDRRVWIAPSGKRITSFSHALNSSTSHTYTYTDINTEMDVKDFGASKLMKYIRFIGDTDDDDVTASSYSSSHNEEWSHIHELQFNAIKIKYQ